MFSHSELGTVNPELDVGVDGGGVAGDEVELGVGLATLEVAHAALARPHDQGHVHLAQSARPPDRAERPRQRGNEVGSGAPVQAFTRDDHKFYSSTPYVPKAICPYHQPLPPPGSAATVLYHPPRPARVYPGRIVDHDREVRPCR